ncbi:MAG: twin-arginine translocase TatA/TatE family subunit [Deltaproteobacteria bacterium]|nr:twin-arginine translocase TatA/TatE family subunit [Deltaproteobacteria bacterium]
MLGIGTTELIVLLVMLLFLFGGSKLPALGSSIGRGIRSLRDSLRGNDESGSS